MRRIALLLTAVVAFALVQGCGTTNRNKAVVNKPGQAGSTDSSASVAPSAASPKGGTTAKPGAKTDGFYGKGGTTQSAATPAPVKKEVVKAEPKPAKPAPAPKVEKPAPAPAPKKEVAKSTQAEAGAKPRAATDGFYGRGGTTQSAATPAPVKKEKPAPVKKEKPAPVKKEVVKAEPKPKPVKEAPKKETPKKETPVAKPAPAPTPAAEKPVAKVEPAKPGAKLGLVSQVNNEYKFIVIEFEDENKKLAAGSVIQIVRGGKVVAKAKLEEPLDHWPLATATVIEGTPEKADSVSQ